MLSLCAFGLISEVTSQVSGVVWGGGSRLVKHFVLQEGEFRLCTKGEPGGCQGWFAREPLVVCGLSTGSMHVCPILTVIQSHEAELLKLIIPYVGVPSALSSCSTAFLCPVPPITGW